MNIARITRLIVDDGQVNAELRDRNYTLTVKAGSEIKGKLKAPVHGEMNRIISTVTRIVDIGFIFLEELKVLKKIFSLSMMAHKVAQVI